MPPTAASLSNSSAPVVPDFIAEDQIEQALSQKRLHVHGYALRA